MSLKTQKIETRVESITKVRAEGSRWCVRWVEWTPASKAKSSSDQRVVEAFRRELLSAAKKAKSGSKVKLPQLQADDFGSPSFFRRAFGSAAEAASVAAANGDKDALVVLSAFTKILSDLARGWQHYDQSANIEGELEKLIKFHEATRKRTVRENSPAPPANGGIAASLVARNDLKDF